MTRKPRHFTIGANVVKEMLAEGFGWEGIRKVILTNDPGWIGFVRADGTGLALLNPNEFELFELRKQTTPSAAWHYIWMIPSSEEAASPASPS
jgi:hypothetical protein